MIRAILLDLDGTVFRGHTAIPGTEEALEKMRAGGIKIYFLTNANNKTRPEVAEKLAEMGIRAAEDEIYTSSYAAADYVQAKHPGKSVYCISSGGIQQDMKARGIKVVENESAQIVIVGYDPTLTYRKLSIAFRAIENGAVFLATNTDATFPVEEGLLPGSGAMVAAVSASTGKEPLVIGKPNKYGIELLLSEGGLKKADALLIGDRIETDIMCAKRSGLKSCLVLSGITKKKDLERLKKEDMPDHVIGSVRDLPALIEKLNSR